MSDEAFDIDQREGMIFTSETDRMPAGPCAGGAADAVNIIFRVLRQIKIKDVADARNMEATRSDICSNQHLQVP